jgi:hypothetical protein
MEGRRCPWRENRECQQSEDNKPRATFVQSVATPDNTKIAAGAEFVKIWKVRNVGTVAWPENTVLSFVYGDRLALASAAVVPSVNPGEEYDIAVNMTAPLNPGKYANYWRLCSPSGVFFGPPLYTRVIVGAEASHAAPIIEQPVPTFKSDAPLVPEPVPVASAPVAPEVPAPVVPAPAPAPVVPEVPAPVAEVPAPAEPTAEEKAVASLRAMGFTGDLASVLRRNGGDIEATVNALLG